MADFNGLEAEYLVNHRVEQHQPVDQATLDAALGLLDLAVAWNPRNGKAHENLALVHIMRLALPGPDPVPRDEHLQAALSHALIAVSLRPTSGYAYSVYAVAKHLRGEQDAAFRQALALAAKYGPWEPGAQNNVIDIGFRAWSDLDEPAREVVRQTIVRALQLQTDDALAFVRARRALLPACGELKVRIAGMCA